MENVTLRRAGLPQKRSQAFGAVALQRARQMALYTAAPADADAEALDALVQDGLLVQEQGAWRFAPTHDVLEDLALMRFIRDQWRDSGRPAPFFQAIGHEPALRRGFRLWLTDLLAEEGTSDEALTLVGQVMTDITVAPYWRDELLVAIFRSAYAGVFFQRFEAELLRDAAALLRRCAHLLRTACRQNAATTLQAGSVLQPVGSGWSEFLKFCARYWEALADWRWLVVRVLLDWSPAIGPATESLPPGASAAKELVIAMLTEAEQGQEFWQLDLTQSFLPELFQVAYELTELAQPEVEGLLRRALTHSVTEQADWRTRDFYRTALKISLSGLHTSHLCLHLPELVVEIANHSWKASSQPGAQNLYASGYSSMVEREAQFGLLPHQRGIFPAGIYKTPVRLLLTHRADVGLLFVVDFTNYCTTAYAQYLTRYRDGEDRLEEVRFSLNDGTVVTQLGNYDLWSAYRGTSNVAELLTSVLMGVEQYLLERAEHGSASEYEQLRTAFRYLLSQCASVAISGVLASVALAYPDEVGPEWLPLLAVPQFFEWDFSRALRERTALSPIDREIVIAQKERHASNSLPHRTRYMRGLLDFVPRYQLRAGQFTAQVHAALDQHKQVLTEQSPVLWRQRLNDMDVRDWQIESVDEENESVVLAPVYDAPVQAARAAEEPYHDALSQRLSIASWIGNVLDGKTTEPPEFAAWERAYTAYTASGRQPDFQNRLSGLAIIGLRYFAAQLNPHQRQWSWATLSESITFRLKNLHNSEMPVTFDERNSLLDQQYVWQSFALLYETANNDPARATIELLLLRIVTAGIPEYQFAFVRNHLQQQYFVQFSDQLAAFAGRLLAYAALLQDERNAERALPYTSRPRARQWQDQSQQRLTTLLASPAPSWEPNAVSFGSHDPYIATQVLLAIPFANTAPIPVAYVQRMVQLTLADLALPENAGGYFPTPRAEQLLNLSTCEVIAQYIGTYLIHASFEQAEAVLALVLSASEHPPVRGQEDQSPRGLCKRVLAWTVEALNSLGDVGAQIVASRTAHFWQLWTYLREWATVPGRRWLASLILLDVQWTAESRYWLPLESGREEYLRALRQFGDTDLRAAMRVLATAGSRALLPAALPVVVELLKAHHEQRLLLSSSTTELVVQHLFQQHLGHIKSRPPLLEDLLWLLDAMVDSSSSVAYLIREEVITFKTS